jgi:hypothetical protein
LLQPTGLAGVPLLQEHRALEKQIKSE